MRLHDIRGRLAPAFAVLFALVATITLVACGGDDGHHHGHGHHHHGEAHKGTEAPGDDGQVHLAYSIEPNPPAVGDVTIVLAVTTAEGEPLTEARVKLDPDMPGHGHGVQRKPETTELGDGEYRIDAHLHMPGIWHLLFHVEKGDIHDHATFEIEVK